MPHLRCSSCGVVSYAPVNGLGAVCPECGLPWPVDRADPLGQAARERRLSELMRMTRELLDADLAMLSQITDEQEIITLADGGWPGVGSLQGASAPLQDTVCNQFLQGRIGNLVTDLQADPELRALPVVQRLGLGTWLGVPIRVGDARLYMLCCLAREAQPSLGPREVKLLSGLAESVRAQLQAPVGSSD